MHQMKCRQRKYNAPILFSDFAQEKNEIVFGYEFWAFLYIHFTLYDLSKSNKVFVSICDGPFVRNSEGAAALEKPLYMVFCDHFATLHIRKTRRYVIRDTGVRCCRIHLKELCFHTTWSSPFGNLFSTATGLTLSIH